MEIITLANKIVVALIGSYTDLIFDDNSLVKPKAIENFYINSEKAQQVIIHGKSITIGKGGILILSNAVISEAEIAVKKYLDKEIDIILASPFVILFLYEYFIAKDYKIPLYFPKIFAWEDEVPICKIDYFIEFNPNDIKYDYF